MSWQVQVEVTRDGRRHLRASFERSPITFGARPDNDVVLADPHVSGLHAVVMVSRAELVVQDESRNGSFVGERRIVGQHQLGRHGVLRIPPFAIELTFEPGDEQRQTVQRRVEPPAEGPGAAPAAADGEPATPSLAELSLVHDAPPSPAPESPHATVAVRELTDEPPPAVLEVISGPEHLVGQCFELPVVGAAEIGRSEEADVRIADRTVSRLHAVITRQRDGGYRISDLDSANGVLVDGRRVRFAALHDGDAITVGQVVLTLRWPTLLASGTAGDQPEPAAPEPAAPELAEHELLPPIDPPVRPPPPSRGPLDAIDIHVRPFADVDGAVLIDVRGPIDGYNDRQLAGALERAVGDGARAIVADLEGVGYLGLTALGCLASTLERLEDRGGDLLLVGAGRRVREALALSHLADRFADRLLPDRAAARAHLAGRA